MNFHPSQPGPKRRELPAPSASPICFCIFNLSFCFFSAFSLSMALTVLVGQWRSPSKGGETYVGAWASQTPSESHPWALPFFFFFSFIFES